MKVGAMVESFGLGFEDGVRRAAKLGLDGIQLYAVAGRFGPDEATDEILREAYDFVTSHGLVFSAICGDFGGGFTSAEANKIKVEKSKRVLENAKKLHCDIVTTHIGVVPEQECETKEIMRKACAELASFADSIGSSFAVETGPEKGKVLAEFLDSLGAGGVRVNFDPANLVMCSGERPEEALPYLSRFVVHTHAKDGLLPDDRFNGHAPHLNPESVWRKVLSPSGSLEVPLGTGDVNFDTYLPLLHKAGFDGFLTIERECGDRPDEDIAMAASFLREKIKKFGYES